MTQWDDGAHTGAEPGTVPTSSASMPSVVAAMLRELDRPNVGLCLDAPLFKERQSDEYVVEAVRACGQHVLLTH